MQRNICLQDTIRDWELYTLQADACYHRKELKLACKHFSQTVDLIEPWLDHNQKPEAKLIRLFVLSCHNAGYVQLKMKKLREAEYYYSHAHFRLLSMMVGVSKLGSSLESLILEIGTTFKELQLFLLGQNKHQLAIDIRNESLRVMGGANIDVSGSFLVGNLRSCVATTQDEVISS